MSYSMTFAAEDIIDATDSCFGNQITNIRFEETWSCSSTYPLIYEEEFSPPIDILGNGGVCLPAPPCP